MNDNKNRPVVLCIMDGWGIDKDSDFNAVTLAKTCLLYTSPSPRDRTRSRMPSSA